MSDADKAYQIALDRIERAKAQGARTLSLSPNYTEFGQPLIDVTPDLKKLRSIPDEISTLNQLEHIYLGNTSISDISILSNQKMIKELLCNDTNISDIGALNRIYSIEKLLLHRTKLTDISPLRGLINIKILWLTSTAITSVSDLSNLRNLEILDLDFTDISNLYPLKDMIHLREIWLSDTKVENLEPISKHRFLNTLTLRGTDADLHSLVKRGAAWEKYNHALLTFDFGGTPETRHDGCLAGVEEAYDDASDRTKAALAALRAERDRRNAAEPEPPALKDDDYRFEVSADGRLDLTDTPLLDYGDQAVLQEDLRQRAEDLGKALTGSNEFAYLANDAARYAALLAKPSNEIGAKQVWSLAHRFRAALDVEVEADRQARLSDLLPPRAKAALKALVVTGGAWLLNHPGVAALEEKSRRYRRGTEDDVAMKLAAPIISNLNADDSVMTPASAAVGIDNLRQASIGGPIGDMAIKQTHDFTRGAVIEMLKRIWKGGVWGAGGLVFIGGLDGGLAAIARFVARNGPALRDWMSKVMADGVEYLEAILKGLEMLF